MPKTQNTAEQVTAGFGKRTFGAEILELPSGARVRVRRPGLEALLREGVIDQFDGLASIVSAETIPQAKGMPPNRISTEDAEKMLQDPQKILGLTRVMDRIAMAVVTEPRLNPVPTEEDLERWNAENPDDLRKNPDDLRDDEESYVDYVPFDDKAFIMNFAVGGTRDLERFRAESQAALGLLHDGEADEDQA